jgi:hypothetical protein
MHILVRTTHYGVHLTYELRLFLHISERPVIVKAFIYVRVLNSRWSVQTLLFSPWVQRFPVSSDCPCSLRYTMSTLCCTCILWISQVDYYYLCWVIAGYSKLSGAMTFHLSVKVSWMNLYCEFYDGWQGIKMCVLHLVTILTYTDGFELPITEG